MDFERSFFEEEVRDGFFVSADMKKAWAAQLEVLSDVDKACRENGIQYFAEWGTLLGAVRHHGFIPWDDDMDICMKRADFNRFIRIAKDIMPEGYQIFNIGSDKDNDNMLARIINGRTIDFSENYLEKYHGFPYVAGLDIFPLDFIAPDKEEDDFLCMVIDIVNSVAKFLRLMEQGDEPMNEENIAKLNANIASIEEICGVKLNKEQDIIQQLNILVDQLCSVYTEEESEEITIRTIWQSNKSYKFPKSYYAKSVRMPFENISIPVPYSYDAILKKKYGDYMKLVHTWDSHDFPFYEKQEQVLLDKGVRFHKFRDSLEDYETFEKQIALIREKRAQLRSIEDVSDRKRKVIFMPYKAKHWLAFDSLYKKFCLDDNIEVKVVPIPYYYKDYKGNVYEYEDECQYPDYVEITPLTEFSLEDEYADEIFIQNPYDDFNVSGTVHPRFYSKILAAHTDKLTYIPAFLTDEIDELDMRAYKAMDEYVMMPGVVYADEVIVQSESIKKLYVKKLCDFYGEDSFNIWNEKIKGEGFPLADADKDVAKRLRMPAEWLSLITNKDGSYKKIILYFISTNAVLEHGKEIFDKIERTMQVFNDYSDVVYPVLQFEENIEEVIEDEMPKYLMDFKMLCRKYDEYIASKEESLVAAEVCDAFYGDASAVAQKCRYLSKPVMIQDVAI